MKKKTYLSALGIAAAFLLGVSACGNSGQPPVTSPEAGVENEESDSTEEGQETDQTDGEGTETAAPEETPETQTVELTGPAAELLDQIVIGWNLGNTLDANGASGSGAKEGLESETSWGNPKTTQELIDLVRDSGFNAVRVPVTWYNHMDENNRIDDQWMDRVQEVVDYVIDDGMYCILNVHHDTGTDGWLRASDTNLEENKAKYAAIWEQISARFADYDEHLLFESFNEILNDNNEWVNPDQRAVEVTNELNQLFVDTVRPSGGNNGTRVLVVNTYCAGANSQVTKDFVLPTDTVENSLIVEAHVYQPFNFTAEEYPTAVTWNGTSIDSYLGNMYTSFTQKGIPVLIGEFGCVDKDNIDQRISWAKYYLSVCEKYGFKCFWWDNGSAYKLINRRVNQVAQKNLLGVLVAAAKGEEYVMQEEDTEEDDGNLCANLDNWTGWVNSAAKATITYLPDGVSVEVTDGGGEEWYIQPSYSNLTLEKGVTYELSFDYTATTNVTIVHNFQQNYDPYEVYASGSAHYSQETQHYTTTFTMSEDTDNNVALVFNCGKHEKEVPYTMTVTNLSLIKVEQ